MEKTNHIQNLELRITNAIPSLVSYMDKNLVYKYANNKYFEWFGISPDEIIGKTVLEILGEEAFNKVNPFIMRALDGEKVSYESMVPYALKESTFVRTDLIPDFDNTGKVLGIFAMIQDFTDLESSYKKLAQLDKAKSEFLKIISHELNTPLNGIIGFSSLLKDKLKGTENEYFVSQIVVSANRLLKLTKTALLITQLNGHTFQLKPLPGNLALLVKESLINKIGTEQSKITVKNLLTDDFPQVCFEIDLIGQVIEHLIDNVTNHVGEDAELEIMKEETDDTISLVFNDNGPGFSEEYLNYLFDFFASFDSTKVADKRYGLGLAFINLVMEAHDGKITLQNNPQGGACVKLGFKKYVCPNAK